MEYLEVFCFFLQHSKFRPPTTTTNKNFISIHYKGKSVKSLIGFL